MSSAEKIKGNERILTYASLVISLVALVIATVAFLSPHTKTIFVYNNGTSNTTLSGYNISSSLITSPLSLSDAPVITQEQPFGSRLTNINAPFNSVELAAINNAPNSYFETAGEMFLNNSLNNRVGAPLTKVPLFIVNGKPTVVYLGSITCVFCAENKWAMALALSRFGNFSNIFKGYSAVGDGDIPTVYWSPAHYNISSTELGSFYRSSIINFVAIEDAAPIQGGFALSSISTIRQRINATNNLAYIDAFKFIAALNGFSGTPYTIWGLYEIQGADAVVFGNSTPTSNKFQLTNMSHEDVIRTLANPNDQFAWSEYAAADYYVAMICKTIGNAAPVCNLPAIKGIEATSGF